MGKVKPLDIIGAENYPDLVFRISKKAREDERKSLGYKVALKSELPNVILGYMDTSSDRIEYRNHVLMCIPKEKAAEIEREKLEKMAEMTLRVCSPALKVGGNSITKEELMSSTMAKPGQVYKTPRVI